MIHPNFILKTSPDIIKSDVVYKLFKKCILNMKPCKKKYKRINQISYDI